MTVNSMIEELKSIEKDNEVYKEIIYKSTSKEEKAACRERLLDNNHQIMHLKSTLAAMKCDPFF